MEHKHRRIEYKKILGLLLIAGGITLLGISYYIKHEVEVGKEKIASAQEKVDIGKKIFSMNSTTKEIGKIATSPIEHKINNGVRDVAYYEKLAYELQIGGVLLFVLGMGLLFLPKKG